MKLLFAIKGLENIQGGAERVICQIASAMADCGHEVSLLSFDRPEAKPFYPISPRVRKIALGIGKVQEKSGLGITLHRMKMLRSILRNERPDCVIAFMISMFVPLSIAAVGLGIRIIGSEHNVPLNYRQRKMQYALFILSTFLMKHVTALSPAVILMYPWCIRRKMIPIPNPVSIPEDLPPHVLQPMTRRIVLNVGRLHPQKDQETLIRSFHLVANEYPDWILRIIGEGPLRGRLESVVDQLGLAGRVELPGTTDKIMSEYANADIFAMSSIYESFGLVTAEAMAHRLPVLGYRDCAGTNELIHHGSNGLLVDGNDRIRSLADGLKLLIDNPKYRQSLGENGYVSVQRFRTHKIQELWEAVIMENACAINCQWNESVNRSDE